MIIASMFFGLIGLILINVPVAIALGLVGALRAEARERRGQPASAVALLVHQLEVPHPTLPQRHTQDG